MTFATLAFIASAVLADATPAPFALDGITLGAKASDVAAAHHGVASKSSAGPVWTWKRADGSVVKVTAGDDGTVAIVDFVVSAGAAATGKVDLPAAPGFALQNGHEKYSDVTSYLESDGCAQPAAGGASCYAFTLDDGSDVLLTFLNNGSGPLHEAVWGDRELLKELGIIVPGTSL